MTLAISITPDNTNALNNISITGLSSPIAFDTVLVQRTNPDGSVVACRNGDNVATGGASTFAFADFEAPLNAPCTYTVTGIVHNADGSETTLVITSSPVTIAWTQNLVWLKCIGQPGLSMNLTLQKLDDVERKARQSINPIIGSEYPVIITDVTASRTGTFTFRTDTLAQRASFLALVNYSGPLMFQADSSAVGDGIEDMYFLFADIKEHRPGLSKDPTRNWECTFTEIASPVGTTSQIPGNSWLLVTSFGSWTSVMNNRTTWLNVLNFPYGS